MALNKKSKEELIDIIRANEFRIRNMLKELKSEKFHWKNHYNTKLWKKRKKYDKQIPNRPTV